MLSEFPHLDVQIGTQACLKEISNMKNRMFHGPYCPTLCRMRADYSTSLIIRFC